MRRTLRLLPVAFALVVSAMLPLEPPPATETSRPKPPGLDAVLADLAPPADNAPVAAAGAWPAIEKIPGIVWVGAGPRPVAAGFERDGVGVLRGVGAVEMTARGPRERVAEIDVLVTSPFAEDPAAAPLGEGFATATAVEPLVQATAGAATACAPAYRATLPGRQSVYLLVRRADAGTLIAFRGAPPVCS